MLEMKSLILWGGVPAFLEVWYYEGGIYNILSITLGSDQMQVQLDTKEENVLILHKPYGTTIPFGRYQKSLHYSDMNYRATGITIITVVDKKYKYLWLDIR